MELERFKSTIIEKASDINIKLEDEKIIKFYKYMNLLIEWNNKINLTTITDPYEIIIKHFIDSLTISKYIDKGLNMVDVGTGAGFPGIPLKIIREDLNITLLDSLNKRINFLDEVIEKIDLDNIQTIHTRVEEFGKNKKYREKFDIATSRAVANLSTLVEYNMPLVKIGGKCICMKGPNIEQELNESLVAIDVVGGKTDEVCEFELPDKNIKRSIVVIKKIKHTPADYPRKPGTPSKDPIRGENKY